MGQKLLTVAVAAYQVEPYLRETLDSLLLPEVLRDIEILVIDDGSFDKTGSIAKEYAEKYEETVRYIYQENGGYGASVERGIAEAGGMFFKTVDGDDRVEKRGFLSLVGYLKLYQEMDLLVTDFWQVDAVSGKKKKKISAGFPGIKYMEPYLFSEISDKTYICMHAITYRTALLKEHPVKLDKHCFYVDAEYALFPLRHVKKVVFLPQPVYLYVIGREGQSMQIKNMQKNCAQHEQVLERVLEEYKKTQEQVLLLWEQAESGYLNGQIGGQMEILEEYLFYLAKGAARLAASQVKIYLSFPAGKEMKQKLVSLQSRMLKEYPEVYAANQNLALGILRVSGFYLYPLAAAFARRML